ncbi:hypothetical protein ACEPPN_019387 [Leptodophora sp. 'Broadleaf-Isolate-01']
MFPCSTPAIKSLALDFLDSTALSFGRSINMTLFGSLRELSVVVNRRDPSNVLDCRNRGRIDFHALPEDTSGLSTVPVVWEVRGEWESWRALKADITTQVTAYGGAAEMDSVRRMPEVRIVKVRMVVHTRLYSS